MQEIEIAILAGGQSRRMGRDKASLEWQGESLLVRTARLSQETDALAVSVIGRPAPADWPLSQVVFRSDEVGGQGPLGGLETALTHSEGRAVLLVACDMPGLTSAALYWLLQAARADQGQAEGLITLNGPDREPLFSVYTPACLPNVRLMRQSGRRSLQALIDTGRFAFVTAPPNIQNALQDVDTPKQLTEAIQSAPRNP